MGLSAKSHGILFLSTNQSNYRSEYRESLLSLQKQYAWSLGAEIARYTIQPIVAIVLARLLSPHDFGLVAMCLVSISLLQVFKDGGLGDVIIRDKDESVVDFAFSAQLAIAIVLSALVLLLAPMIAVAFSQPQLTGPIRVLALTFLISPFIDIPIRLSQRQLNFRVTFIHTVLAPLLGGIVSVSLAFAGWRHWSLIMGTLCGQITSALILPFLTHWRPRFRFSTRGRKDQIVFGLHMTAQAMLRWLRNSIAKLSLGMAGGTMQLGIFEVAQQAANMPYNCIGGSLQKLAFPVFSKHVREGKNPAPAFLSVVHRLSLISIPLGFFLGWSARDGIHLLLGDEWLPMLWIFVACLFVANVAAIVNLNLAVFKAVNRPSVLSWFLTARVILSVPIFAYASTQGLEPLAIAIVGLTIVFAPINSWLVCKVLRTSYVGYVSMIARNSLLPAFVLSAIALLLRQLEMSTFASLSLNTLSFLVVTLANLFLLDRLLLLQIVRSFQHWASRSLPVVET